MLVGGLSTGHKLGLGLMGVAFIVFALVSALVLPRSRPNFPGASGLRWFVVACVAFFAAMVAAVVVFGVESSSEAAAGGGAETAAATTGAAPGASVKKVDVSLVDFKIQVSGGASLAAGKYDFAVSNGGKVPHNLTINGPGVKNAATPTFDPGGSEDLKVTLAPGTYDFYCSVPGHKQLGMDVKVAVS